MTLTDHRPDFQGGSPFPPRSSRKSCWEDRGCIFSRPLMVQDVAFWLVLAAVLIVPPVTGPQAPRPALEDLAVVEEEVEHGSEGRAVAAQFP
jgi:hypothetical protein